VTRLSLLLAVALLASPAKSDSFTSGIFTFSFSHDGSVVYVNSDGSFRVDFQASTAHLMVSVPEGWGVAFNGMVTQIEDVPVPTLTGVAGQYRAYDGNGNSVLGDYDGGNFGVIGPCGDCGFRSLYDDPAAIFAGSVVRSFTIDEHTIGFAPSDEVLSLTGKLVTATPEPCLFQHLPGCPHHQRWSRRTDPGPVAGAQWRAGYRRDGGARNDVARGNQDVRYVRPDGIFPPAMMPLVCQL
jgi:hypothetical protein